MQVARVLPANYCYWINIAVGKGGALKLEKVVEPERAERGEEGFTARAVARWSSWARLGTFLGEE